MKLPEQCFLGTSEPSKKKFDKVINSPQSINKPSGGLWTTDHLGGGRCAWGEWVEDNEFNEEDYVTAWIVTITNTARVLTVDSKNDYEKMIKKYIVPIPDGCDLYINFAHQVAVEHLEPGESLELTKRRIKFREIMASSLRRIDFVRIAKKYDVVRLTAKGLHETSDFRKGNMMLCGWDVPSCFILNWECILKVKEYHGSENNFGTSI